MSKLNIYVDLCIMQPDLSYADALVALDITSLYERRKALSNALFDQIVRDQIKPQAS